MVIWLFGISGSGKTTLGKMLKSYCDENGIHSYMVDGDIVRSFFENDLGYTEEDRIANIKRIILGVHFLNESGVVPIVCNILPFEELRKFLRMKVKDLNLIYLKRSLDECAENDVKGVYMISDEMKTTVGRDIRFDEPEYCDLILDTGKESVADSYNKLLKYLREKYELFN